MVFPVSANWLFFLVLFCQQIKKNNHCMDGNSNLDNGIHFPKLFMPPVLPCYSSWCFPHQCPCKDDRRCSILELIQCTKYYSLGSLSRRHLLFVYLCSIYTGELFQNRKTISSAGCIMQLCFTELSWHGVCPAGCQGLCWFCSSLLVFTLLMHHEQQDG